MSDAAGQPVLLTVAPNGARRGKVDHPALPVSVEETALAAAAACCAGAAMVHLHVRDEAGRHSIDPGRYREAIAAFREVAGPGPVVQVTSEAVGLYSPEQQMASLRDLEPEAASMALRELVPGASEEAAAGRFFAWLLEAGVWPQIILYEPHEIRRVHQLQVRGVLPAERYFLLFVLGRYTSGQQSDPADLLPFIERNRQAGGPDGPSGHPWACCAFGRRETASVVAAAALGGHCRVGFENNFHLTDGGLAEDNAALVAATVEALSGIGRQPMDSTAARAWLAAIR